MADYILPEHIDKIEGIYHPCQQFDNLCIVDYPDSFAFSIGRELSSDEVEAIDKLSAFVAKYIREKGIAFKLIK